MLTPIIPLLDCRVLMKYQMILIAY